MWNAYIKKITSALIFTSYLYALIVNILFGLMWSEKTSVMTTPKHLGVQIWQIYPLVMASSGQE